MADQKSSTERSGEKMEIYAEMKEKTGLAIAYIPDIHNKISVQLLSGKNELINEVGFEKSRIDEAHILYIEAAELLESRSKTGENPEKIRKLIEKLFALYRGEKVSFDDEAAPVVNRKPSAEFIANPGKQIEIDVDGKIYERLPVRTRLITLKDNDIQAIIEEYVKPYIKPGDLFFVSEKALTITQGRVIDMSEIKPTPLARLLARNVSNYYGSSNFRGFGHGTTLAMQLFLEEAGYARVIFAAVISAITRPFGIRGMFYRICGKRAKSIDCPMSFLILDYAHSAKLAPNDPDGAAKKIKKQLNAETVILDANYRGAFSLGKSTSVLSEKFIGKLFRDNPLGQSDEMTPFCIVRKK